MARKSGTWVFDDATERDSFGVAEGVADTDECILISDASRHYFDGAAWQPAVSAAAALAAVLAVGNLTGGTSIAVSVGDAIVGIDATVPGSDGSDYTIRAGDHTASEGVARAGGDITIRGGDTNATPNGSQGGALTLTSGSATPNGSPGKLTATGGTGFRPNTSGLDAEFGGATLLGALSGGTTLFRGTDNDGAAGGGPSIVRGGDALPTGTANSSGGNLTIRAGNYRGNLGGAPPAAGLLFIRGAGRNNVSGFAGSVTGPVKIYTAAVADAGDPTGNYEGLASVATGAITLDTQAGVGVTAAQATGDITLRVGDTNAATGNAPGSISLTAGSCLVDNNFVQGGSLLFTAGDGRANTVGGGGDITLTAGDNTRPGAPAFAGARGGNLTLTAGNTAADGVNSAAGRVLLEGGDGTGTNSNGGDIELAPGAATGTGAPGRAVIDGLSYPSADGSAGQAIVTDGAGDLSFQSFRTKWVGSVGLNDSGVEVFLSVQGDGTVIAAQGQQTYFLAPADLRGMKVELRSTDAAPGGFPGNTDADVYVNRSGVSSETVGPVNITADQAYEFEFTSPGVSAGDLFSIGLTPTTGAGEFQVVITFDYDWSTV